MTSERRFNDEIKSKSHFDIVNSGDDDEEQAISLSSSSSMDEQQTISINKVQTFDDQKLNKLYDNWLELDGELRAFEIKHKVYVTKLDEVESLKTQYRNEFDKYQKKIIQLQENVAQLRKSHIKKG